MKKVVLTAATTYFVASGAMAQSTEPTSSHRECQKLGAACLPVSG